MFFAVGSEKATIEYQEYILLAQIICKADFISNKICQREIWGGFVEFDAAHAGSTKMMPKIISTTKLIQLDCTEDLSKKMEISRTMPMAKYMMPSI